MKNERLRFLLITFFSVAAILAVLEIISRAILQNIYNRSFDSSLLVDNTYFSSSGLKENAEGLVWGKHFRTDEFGCRKNAMPFNQKKKKWLFIGDSVTEGVGVEDSSTFSYICSREISEFNVLNYSLIGYSTNDYLNVLKHTLESDTSIQLVTIFYTLNDVYGSSEIKDLPFMGTYNFMHSAYKFMNEKYATLKLAKLFWYRNSESYFRYDLRFYKKGDSHFVESMYYLAQCDSLCRSKNVYLNLVVLPYKSQLRGENKGNRVPQNLIQDFCTEKGIDCNDALPWLEKKKNPEALFLFADEIHYSDYGHSEIAEFIIQ